MKVYRIRDKKSGLFSLGGCNPDWNKEGKIWKNIGHVKNHLHQLGWYDYRYNRHENNISEDWEVIEYELTETYIKSVSAKSLID